VPTSCGSPPSVLSDQVIALLAPGQGSQTPGMLGPWLDDPAAGATLDTWSAATGLDLRRLGTTGDADEIKDTAVTQPLVVAAALLAAGAFRSPAGAVIAGHSVGELAAAAVAGVIPALDAVDVAAVRGAAMGAACALTPTGMSAVMGGNTDEVLAALAELDLVGANVNGGGQIVAAGPLSALEELAATPPGGVRVIPLPVAGAFHTSFMAGAESALQERLAQLTPADPLHPLLTNSDGTVVASGSAYLKLLAAQVTRPVRWDACMQTMRALGVTGVLELPPSGALVGLVKRDLKGVATMALKSPADLENAVAFTAEHAGVRL
jgi:[acyl-carrier-protein] S-malonyltransferase